MVSSLVQALDVRSLRRMTDDLSFHRGQQYEADGRVLSVSGDASAVRATVRGTRVYDVTFAVEGGQLEYACTCPRASDGDFCKHCVAAALAWAARAQRPSDGTGPASRRLRAVGRPSAGPSWKRRLASLEQAMGADAGRAAAGWPADREIVYVLDTAPAPSGLGLTLHIHTRRRKANGGWQIFTSVPAVSGDIDDLPDPADREIFGLMVGTADAYGYAWHYQWSLRRALSTRHVIPAPLQGTLIPLAARTGRLRLRLATGHEAPVEWDDGAPWDLHLEVAPDEAARGYTASASLRRGDEQMALGGIDLMLPAGFVFSGGRAGRLAHPGAFAWISELRRGGPISVPASEAEEWLAGLVRLPALPSLALPPELRYEEVAASPSPRLAVRAAPRERHAQVLWGALSFDYAGVLVDAGAPGRGRFQRGERRLIVRDAAAEQRAESRLLELGFRPTAAPHHGTPAWELPPKLLPRATRDLVREGWRVEAEGRLYRSPGAVTVQVATRIDWFELSGAVSFGDASASLPAVLAAARRGDTVVALGDGTFGVLPEEWLARYGLLAGLGTHDGDRLRFARSQAGLLDALLDSQPGASWDEGFAQARQALERFAGVAPADPPAGFHGVLRDYQRDGLGWHTFLQQFGFGGCLADDMGLGKTVQVLALLLARRRESAGPSLVVVPKSLVFNWKQEAARFAPELRVLDHTGAGRAEPGDHYRGYDLVLTTYGTLRRDAAALSGFAFDYVILDEAQAIKNAATATAKAARLLRGAHRLALSGTPVENHLGELWSLFEFLNPGMLGASSAFRHRSAELRNPSAETRALLAEGLRPFVLRRTKEQVVRELPPKLEQTLYCDLEAPQRAAYDQILSHYRRSLLARVERDGLGRSKIMVLEALLRLRQAACHIGLIDRARAGEPSAKLDVLLARLTEVIEGGHKALVFSQFTRFLAIVRDRLDREHVPYAYLDGRTHDRAARVAAFEQDPDCRLFLVSLKAGGLGLNLTAADYVFLLDPWWNPAVEAQAIDRTHRIGQVRPVFAYRLIARDTVEEKVLALQESKRSLAESIITADNSLIRTLTREDLALLLS